MKVTLDVRDEWISKLVLERLKEELQSLPRSVKIVTYSKEDPKAEKLIAGLKEVIAYYSVPE